MDLRDAAMKIIGYLLKNSGNARLSVEIMEKLGISPNTLGAILCDKELKDYFGNYI